MEERVTMLHSENISKKELPITALLTILIITLSLFIGVGWQFWSAHKDIRRQGRDVSLQKLVGIIIHLDELLTMSACMGVETGNVKWEERYLEFLPQLDVAIKEAEKIAPEVFLEEAAAQTDAANIKLVSMEKHAFELVRQGQKEDALAILFSEGYEEQKFFYAKGMKQIKTSIQESIVEHLRKRHQHTLFISVAIFITLPALVVAWIYVLRLMNGRNIARKMAEYKLKELNEELESQVNERTVNLKESNEQLITEIIERENAEATLRKLSHAIEQSSSTVLITDTEGNIEYVNPWFSELTGYSFEETIGKNAHITKSGKTPPEKYKELWEAITSGKGWRGELCNRKKNGELFWESTLISPVKDDKGIITNFIAIKDDITERKKAEKELRQYGHIVSCSTDMLAFLDRKLVYIAANQAYLKAFNKSSEDLLGHTAVEVFGIEYFQKIIKLNAELCLTGEEVHFQAWFEYPAYGRRYMDIAYYPYIDENNEISGFVVNGRDITERKKMEEVFLKSEKLKSIGKITAGISHEFNNILAVISGNVQLLEETYKDHGELTECLRVIKRATEDGSGISRKMIKFTRASQGTSEFKPFDIKKLIDQSIEFTMPRWKNMAQARGINYLIDKEGVKNVSSIMCNPTEIREVFVNIINNALDAMPEGGSLSLSTRRNDDTVFVDISDTGEGIPEEAIKNIFDPFFTTKNPVGTGLGMSITYGIVTRHGGEIDLKSEVGKGTTFTLQFSITNKRASLIVTHKQEQKTNKVNLRILIVDDEEAICNLLDKFLSRCGHKVKIINNGADAIELMKKEEFELVLCDIAMPDTFGYDVVRSLNGSVKRPKIGIITGWNERLWTRGEEMKVDFIIKKPFGLAELEKKINSVLTIT
jgi:nitrogen fixation negative regulator NifL